MKKQTHISLEEIGKKLPFKVPENYFEEFASQIDEQIAPNKPSWKQISQPWLYLVALFVGILFMVQIFYTVYVKIDKKQKENYELYVLSQIDEPFIMNYYLINEENNLSGNENEY
jgi:D-alanyl-lipoteichoic acid acyltransferase DltB (MBOAT superfamily)